MSPRHHDVFYFLLHFIFIIIGHKPDVCIVDVGCCWWWYGSGDIGGGRENRSKVHIELCCVLIYLMDESSKAHWNCSNDKRVSECGSWECEVWELRTRGERS